MGWQGAPGLPVRTRLPCLTFQTATSSKADVYKNLPSALYTTLALLAITPNLLAGSYRRYAFTMLVFVTCARDLRSRLPKPSGRTPRSRTCVRGPTAHTVVRCLQCIPWLRKRALAGVGLCYRQPPSTGSGGTICFQAGTTGTGRSSCGLEQEEDTSITREQYGGVHARLEGWDGCEVGAGCVRDRKQAKLHHG